MQLKKCTHTAMLDSLGPQGKELVIELVLGGAALLGDSRTSLKVVPGGDCHHRWVGNSKVLLEEQVKCLDSVLGLGTSSLCAPPQRVKASFLPPPSHLHQGGGCLQLSPRKMSARAMLTLWLNIMWSSLCASAGLELTGD